MKKSISLFSQLHKKAIFYGIVGESGWFQQMLASRKTTAEYTELTETVLISVNPCLKSQCYSVSFMQNKPNFLKNRAIISYGKAKRYENEPPFLA